MSGNWVALFWGLWIRRGALLFPQGVLKHIGRCTQDSKGDAELALDFGGKIQEF